MPELTTGQISPAWIAVDWGTSHMRAWAMGPDGSVLAQAKSARGAGTLAQADCESVLLDVIDDWVSAPTPVLICGAIGAREGWVEAPYGTVPCAPLSGVFATAPTTNPNLHVYIIGGLRQTKPAYVMRGEETQIAGFVALNPKWDGVICLPGTHTHWALISAGEVVGFQTCMTGDMFNALTTSSVLRHNANGDGWDDAAFLDAVQDGLSRPELMAARLFSLRAENLLADLSPDTIRARLSGTLIGAELAASKPYWLGQNLAIIGDAPLAAHYHAALKTQGATAMQVNAEAATLAGLRAAFTTLNSEDRT